MAGHRQIDHDLSRNRKRRRPPQRRDTDETADGRVLVLYVIAILTSLFFVTKFALGL